MKLFRILAFVRIGLVPLGVAKMLVDRELFPEGYEAAAWAVVAGHALAAIGLLALAFLWRGRLRYLVALSVVADMAIVSAYMFAWAWEPSQPLRALHFLVVLEAALFFRLVGGLVAALATAPILLALEHWRNGQFDAEVHYDALVLRVFVAVALGIVVGRLVEMERGQRREAEDRAAEAERLRDELGRRIDVLEATSRAARALGSSLDLDAAFAAFVQELRGLLAFDRAAHPSRRGRRRARDGDRRRRRRHLHPARNLDLAAGLDPRRRDRRGADRLPRGHLRPALPEEAGLVELGVRARVLAPLQLGARSIGALALSRNEPGSFRPEEIELVTLLGRLVATAVQNLRTHEAERATVEELRRLSSLRADFVSLVSHELRSPMAAVIGSARTLQQRWRELRPEQREAFLAVIADETSRLAALVGDVLDTSRIEAGTFSYHFTDVDLVEVVRDSVAAAEIGQDEVRLTAELPPRLPGVRGDAERLRQLIDNLLSNAIKYSKSGGEVLVDAHADDGHVIVRVRDSGPGIALEHHGQIFEKFGRVGGSAKPGTGLGLFLSRSFAEAHGGTLGVESHPGEGATFTLTLPATPGASHGSAAARA